MPIASITKLMTVLVTLQHARLDDVVTVSRNAAEVGESSIYLRTGDRLTVQELVEAALSRARTTPPSRSPSTSAAPRRGFVAMMNAEAQRLGLRDTHFENPDGLDEAGHYSSACDVTRLARIAMKNPVIRAIVGDRTATISGGRQLHDLERPALRRYPGRVRRQDRPHVRGGLVRGRRARGRTA